MHVFVPLVVLLSLGFIGLRVPKIMGIMEEKMETTVWGLGFWWVPKIGGYLFGGPHEKDFRVLGSTLRSPTGNYHVAAKKWNRV